MKSAEEDNHIESLHELRRSIHELTMNGTFSPYQIAAEAGVKRLDMMAWIEMKADIDQELVERLRTWLQGVIAPGSVRSGVTLEKPGWVETPTARKIMEALDFARFTPSISVIYGGAGVGKTETVKHFSKTQPRTWLVTAAQCRRTTVSILMALAETTGLRGFAYRAERYMAKLFTRWQDIRRFSEASTVC